jgi:8-oxo-dGTP pyrophosphatase MutT (NUDIX family)
MTYHSNTQLRMCVRIILLNAKNELLLLKVHDPKTTTPSGHYNGPFWFLAGGGIEPGENCEQATLREIFEETGITKEHITLGPIVWKGEFDLLINGVLIRQNQRFIVAKTATNNLSLENLLPEEKMVIKDIRWFSLDDIQKSSELIYPLCLREYLPDILRGCYPEKPIEIDIGADVARQE